MTADEIAARLLNKPLTEQRVMKLRRLLARDQWARPQVIDTERVTAMLDAIEKHPSGGETTRAFVHKALVEGPPRTIPPLPDDIAEKVQRFHEQRAAKARANQ